MRSKLSTEKLAKAIRLSRRHHRKTVETFLNEFAAQPPCGCILKWKWVWGEGSSDWIFPLDVHIFPMALERVCSVHHLDYWDLAGFRNTIFENLQKARRDTKNQIGCPDIEL
jgi:hypothetical protein